MCDRELYDTDRLQPIISLAKPGFVKSSVANLTRREVRDITTAVDGHRNGCAVAPTHTGFKYPEYDTFGTQMTSDDDTPVIRTTDLRKEYGSTVAVENVSLEVTRNEIFGLLGPNGAGKTTTVEMLQGLRTPTSGDATVLGMSIEDNLYDIKDRIGVVPQSFHTFERLSVRENVRLIRKLHSDGLDTDSVLDELGLTKYADDPFHSLSGGYQRRTGIAMALVSDPDILFLDEPTTGLDPNQIAEIRELIKEIGTEKTVMLSSHILKEVEMTCDRILIIDQGRVVADGPTEKLREQFMGGTRLRVSVDAPGDADVGRAFREMEGVASVQRTNGTYELAADGDAEPAANVFRLCANRDWTLTELTPIESSLEDVFRKLTEAPASPADATAEAA